MESERTIHYEFKSAEEVQRAYMPFVSGAGIFIQTQDEYALGEMLPLFLKFPGADEELELVGKVIWVTPDPSKISWISTSTTSGDRMHAGAGFQVSGPSEGKFQEKILELMSGVDANFPTDTV
jgi:type IV pilus assembly protein PilZ